MAKAGDGSFKAKNIQNEGTELSEEQDSSAIVWAANACKKCGGRFEFDISRAGESFPCPHCGEDAVLTVKFDRQGRVEAAERAPRPKRAQTTQPVPEVAPTALNPPSPIATIVPNVTDTVIKWKIDCHKIPAPVNDSQVKHVRERLTYAGQFFFFLGLLCPIIVVGMSCARAEPVPLTWWVVGIAATVQCWTLKLLFLAVSAIIEQLAISNSAKISGEMSKVEVYVCSNCKGQVKLRAKQCEHCNAIFLP